MDIVWCALIGAFFLLTVALAIGCERLMPRRKWYECDLCYRCRDRGAVTGLPRLRPDQGGGSL